MLTALSDDVFNPAHFESDEISAYLIMHLKLTEDINKQLLTIVSIKHKDNLWWLIKELISYKEILSIQKIKINERKFLYKYDVKRK